MADDDSFRLPLYCPLIVNGEEGKASSGRQFKRENPADIRQVATIAEQGTLEDARAAIVGLSSHSNRGHVVRAALEAIAYQLRDILEMLQSESAVTVRRLRCDGGPTRSNWLMQFTADLLGMELHLPQQPDCSASLSPASLTAASCRSRSRYTCGSRSA